MSLKVYSLHPHTVPLSLQKDKPLLKIAQPPKENSISQDRSRTNILKGLEQPVLVFLCRIMPLWVTSDILTAVGFIGSGLVALGFVLAKTNHYYLIFAIGGFAVQWFGDSLDGRLAYYRNTPRKWYGFSLDICMDWLSIMLIGIGFYYFLPASTKLLAFLTVSMYGWAILLALLKYKITGDYVVDTGLFGPTEFRVSLCLVMLAEVLLPGTLTICVAVVNLLLFFINSINLHKLLQLGNLRDQQENGKLHHYSKRPGQGLE